MVDGLMSILGLKELIETFKVTFMANVTGYSLGICTLVGTVSLFLKILGFNTQKWALLCGAVLLFIILVIWFIRGVQPLYNY